MKILLYFAGLLLCNSCTTKSIFNNSQTAHEQYADGIKRAALHNTFIGKRWLTIAENCLQQPLPISLPYKEAGYFSPTEPAAIGLSFSLKRGEQLQLSILTVPISGALLFTELWYKKNTTQKAELVAVIDSATNKLEHVIDKEGIYIIRIQPELLRGIEYTVTINTSPSLAFPVHNSGNPQIISLWGVGRDKGSRKHEGIDIGAKFRTPALAAADGYIRQVGENNLGGKVIFLQPQGRNYSIYYAHLDSQIAKENSYIKKGQVIGLIGNTGNARNTVPHLHLGIYTNGGAIDPYPFIARNRPDPKDIVAEKNNIGSWISATQSSSVYMMPDISSSILQKNSDNNIMKVVAATGNWYRIMLPDGMHGYVSSNSIKNKTIRNQNIAAPTRLLDEPNVHTAAITTISPGNTVEIKGKYKDLFYVKYKDINGWVYLQE